MPVVANIFADRGRLAHISGAASPADFNEAWLRVEANPMPPQIVDGGLVQEMIHASLGRTET
jgi:hypothetical protein